jgi:hypothetical protein
MMGAPHSKQRHTFRALRVVCEQKSSDDCQSL